MKKKTRQITCEEAMHVMFEYIDGMLEKENRSQLEEHIETCRGCLEKAEFQLRLKKKLSKVKPPTVSKKLSKRLNLILGQ